MKVDILDVALGAIIIAAVAGAVSGLPVRQDRRTVGVQVIQDARDSLRLVHEALDRIEQRLADAVDAVTVAPEPSAPSYAVEYFYASAANWIATTDTVTVCAVVTDRDNRQWLAWPVVRLTRGRADSTGWINRSGNPLSIMCAKAIAAAGLSTTDSLSVNWVGTWIDWQGRRLFRPFVSVP